MALGVDGIMQANGWGIKAGDLQRLRTRSPPISHFPIPEGTTKSNTRTHLPACLVQPRTTNRALFTTFPNQTSSTRKSQSHFNNGSLLLAGRAHIVPVNLPLNAPKNISERSTSSFPGFRGAAFLSMPSNPRYIRAPGLTSATYLDHGYSLLR